MGERGRVPALDGLRGVAILGVVAFHAGGPVGGHLGVPVFFTLSGYLITRLLLDEHAQTGRVDLRAFYRRRVARLAPLILVAVVVLVIVMLAAGRAAGRVGAGAALTLGYGTNLGLLAVPDVSGPWMFTWSLAQEEQFYLLWPVLLAAWAVRSRRGAWWLMVGVVLGCWLVRLWLLLRGDHWQATFAPWARMDTMAVGCALALRPVSVPRAVSGVTTWAALVVLGWLFWTQPLGPGEEDTFLVGMTAAPLVTALLIAAAGRALEWRPLRYLGRISYGVYIWHAIAMTSLGVTLGSIPGVLTPVWIVGSVAAAALSWRYLEQPVLRWARRQPWPVSAESSASTNSRVRAST